VRLVDAAALTSEQRSTLEEVYVGAFPDKERAPFDSLFADDVLAMLDGQLPVGILVLRDLGETGWRFVRYLAVGPKGGGLGSRMWQLLVEASRDYSRIVLDVEDPEEPGIAPEERELRLRRIGFYERLGLHFPPGVRGYAPPHDGVPLPLHPMVADVGAVATPPLDDDDLRAVLVAVYRFRYGLAADAPETVLMLEASGLGR
jgi:hypothetical protein